MVLNTEDASCHNLLTVTDLTNDQHGATTGHLGDLIQRLSASMSVRCRGHSATDHTGSFPHESARFCLSYTWLSCTPCSFGRKRTTYYNDGSHHRTGTSNDCDHT